MGDGQDPVEHRHDLGSGLGQGGPLLLGGNRLGDRIDDRLERLQAVDLGHARGVDREGLRGLHDPLADVDELRTNAGDFVNQRLPLEERHDWACWAAWESDWARCANRSLSAARRCGQFVEH